MTTLNFQTSDWSRKVANSADLILKNRYFESDPSLTENGATMLPRPGMRNLTTIGQGPIRGLGSEAGSFGGDLFIASFDQFYRMDNNLNQTLIYTGLDNPLTGVVNIAITGAIGTTPEYCFVADGRDLFVYIADGYAFNILTGSPAAADVVRLDTIYYKWTAGGVDVGTPDGTVANPWLVALGVTPLDAYTNLANAINTSGVAGTDYSSATQINPTIKSTASSATEMVVRATVVGALGNGLPSTVTGAGITWTNGTTLTGGGTPTFQQVEMPDDVGAIDVAVINSYVIVIPVQDTIPGQFYWIKPGETTIDPLDFATAERSPDQVFGVQVFGDQFWLPGESTTEVWYVTGNPDAPMERLQGIVYDRGSWENTAKAVHETMIIVDADGGVFAVQGGAPQRLSNPGIEEQIRNAMSFQRFKLA